MEDALLNGEIDLAVHSLKDMPTTLPQGLCLTAITERAHAYDAFVSNKYDSIEALPIGAIIGTSSLRRKAQLLAQRPDFNIVDLRGNVDTRLRKLDEGNMDAIILAAAGLERLGYHERIKSVLPGSFCLPAVGQGALAIECAEANFETRQMLAFLNDEKTKQATTAERAFLGFLEGGCQVPIGVHAIVSDDTITVEAIIATLDGSKVLRDKINGKPQEALVLGEKLAKIMLENGGREILATIK